MSTGIESKQSYDDLFHVIENDQVDPTNILILQRVMCWYRITVRLCYKFGMKSEVLKTDNCYLFGGSDYKKGLKESKKFQDWGNSGGQFVIEEKG